MVRDNVPHESMANCASVGNLVEILSEVLSFHRVTKLKDQMNQKEYINVTNVI